ncbi:sulfate reduction electron transfer complex DsrMKJOP subunit DsrO [Halorhodospira halochloris]|uniref:sulfate reduction electron transfer complex DsrMKJOP subunit DsrO n=1 Tax=Halorhodospira halochloris TaxID=1052 RepID=UPI001EE7E123|nr:4Fe-4S dicluster domain-containing protein [Halorhodospira halochloris]MCG5547786.1 4Fe-4S dicluster domain-containing protein [Halorhodospira halochloris]
MSREPSNCPSRRRFLLQALGAGGAVAGMTVAPGVVLISTAADTNDTAANPPGAGADAAKRWGLLIDTRRCAEDCTACISACQQENGWEEPRDPDKDPQWIRKMKLTGQREEPISLPLMCQHCKHPPCASVCPTQATFKRADGIVLVDKHRCIGCRYCMIACPFQARFMPQRPLGTASPNHPRAKGAAEGCTLCVQRIDRGEQPACVERCAEQGNKALLFGDLNDPQSSISQALRQSGGSTIRADQRLEPAVHYQGIV